MIGFFHRCSIYGTVVDGISREFSALITKAGNIWHVLLFVWTLLFTVLHKDVVVLPLLGENQRTTSDGIGRMCGISCLVATIHLIVNNGFSISKKRDSILRNMHIRLLKLSALALHMTLPIVFLNYVWFPFQNIMSCALLLGSNHVARNIWCPLLSVGMAMLFTYFVLVQKTKFDKSTKKSQKTPKKQPHELQDSGRITRQSAMKSRLRSSSTTMTPEQPRYRFKTE